MTREQELVDKITKRGWSSLTKAEHEELALLRNTEPVQAIPEPRVEEEDEEDAEF